MQTSNVKIKFETFNEHNCRIDIASNDSGALQGLSLSQEELPAEISFRARSARATRMPPSSKLKVCLQSQRSVSRVLQMRKWLRPSQSRTVRHAEEDMLVALPVASAELLRRVAVKNGIIYSERTSLIAENN